MAQFGLERSVRDAEVTGSSPVAPTIYNLPFNMKKRVNVLYSGRAAGFGHKRGGDLFRPPSSQARPGGTGLVASRAGYPDHLQRAQCG